MDGNSATNWNKNSCTHTKKEDKAWWMVDLGKVERVTEVFIVNRVLSDNRVGDFEIRVGRLPFVTSPVTLTDICTSLHKLQIIGLHGFDYVIAK